jgi:hypothetical protein
MKFDYIIGNPPYQEQISDENSNASLSRQLFPLFIKGSIEIGAKRVALITPSRWFTGNAQDKSFVKLREFIKENNHIKVMYNYKDGKEVFPNTQIAGGICYFLYDEEYTGKVHFVNVDKSVEKTEYRDLFEDDLDIIISDSNNYSILSKVKNSDGFESFMSITKGRDAFGVVGKVSELEKITSNVPFDNSIEVFCAHEIKRYIKREFITKNTELIDKWKVFTSKGNGGAGTLTDGKQVAIIGKAFIGKPKTVCTDSLIPIGSFNTEKEAMNLKKYMATKFLRFMVGILKTSQNIYQIVYRFVPIQNFTASSDINWDASISDIDTQLFKKYNFTQEEIKFVESHVKEME